MGDLKKNRHAVALGRLGGLKRGESLRAGRVPYTGFAARKTGAERCPCGANTRKRAEARCWRCCKDAGVVPMERGAGPKLAVPLGPFDPVPAPRFLNARAALAVPTSLIERINSGINPDWDGTYSLVPETELAVPETKPAVPETKPAESETAAPADETALDFRAVFTVKRAY